MRKTRRRRRSSRPRWTSAARRNLVIRPLDSGHPPPALKGRRKSIRSLPDRPLSPREAVGLIREFLAADGGMRLTPELFGRRLARQPPTQLELPDRVALSGASLAAFLESAHFPFGQYRAGEEW